MLCIIFISITNTKLCIIVVFITMSEVCACESFYVCLGVVTYIYS